jgi:AraC-like DNA-binding protein
MRPDPENFRADLESVHRRLRAGKLRIQIPVMVGLHRRWTRAQFHPTPEFFLQTGGATDFDCPGGKFRLQKNEVCVMPAGVPHAETPVDLRTPYSVMVAAQDADGCLLLRGSADASRRIESHAMSRFAGSGYAFQFLEQAARHLSIHQPLRRSFVEGLIDSFLAALLTSILQPEASQENECSLLVAGAMKLVRVGLSKPEMTVASIAGRLGCSPDHLTRRFSAERGMTLNVWIARERVQLACDLLARPGPNVKEIAWTCGFSNASYFIRVFRAHTGLTPRVWRRQLSQRIPPADTPPSNALPPIRLPPRAPACP